MRAWPYWPMIRARSEPSTEMSSRTRVRSPSGNRNVRFLPVSQILAASTSMPNGSPGSVRGCGRPSEAAAAEDAESIPATLRRHSSPQDRSNGHQSAITPCWHSAGALSRLALVAGLDAQAAVGLGGGNLAVQDPVDLLAHGHLDVVAHGQFVHCEGGADALGHGSGRAEDLVQRLARAELLAEGPVAAQRAHAGGEEIAQAGQAGECGRLAAHGHAEPGEFGQAAGDHRGPGVVTHAEALRDAGRDRHHVLERTAELAADYVVVGVD